ncbi:MAG: hypothetical protein WCY32_14560 [Burkholderiaceae bacterium]
MSNPYSRTRRAKRRRERHTDPTSVPGLFDFLETFDHDDLSNGAWQAVIEDGVKAYNKEFGTNVDPFEGFMAYVRPRE